MFAKIIKDNRFRFDKTKSLKLDAPVTVRMSVDNGVIGNIAVGVRDAGHKDLTTVGVKDLPLSTGPTGKAIWTFDPSQLNGPRYLIWNTWANYNGPSALQFTVKVEVEQNLHVFSSTLKCEMEAGELVAAVAEDGLWIGAPL